MKKQKTLLLIVVTVATILLTGFLLIKPAVDNKTMQPCNPLKTDCLGSPPLATSSPVVEVPTPSGQIDEHLFIDNTLRDVNFCGKTYQVKQVLIDGVDVVQRVAELARENKSISAFPRYKGTGEVCRKIMEYYKNGSELKFSGHVQKKTIPRYYTENIDYTTGIDYPEIVGTLFQFDISTPENIIYEIGEEGGDFVTRIPIGVLKK